MPLADRTLLLSVDFEDWHQLVRRRLGDPRWEQPGPALARQTEATLALLRSLGVRCTFFILGIAARAHPQLVRAIADAGHEIACHGDQHRPVHTQTPEQFAADLRAARETVERLTGVRPAGYRAPAFSILERQSSWAYRVLADEGFAYDASQCDSFLIRGRIDPASGVPHELDGLWELPVAVWRIGPLRLPVGGASYWSFTPTPLVLRGLGAVGPGGGLYLHPYELDPEPLRPGLDGGFGAGRRARGWLRTARRNLARRRAGETLRAIAASYRLITYGEAHAQLSAGVPAGT
jgi:polysaccharide deacetylase family protein (PEP-CTERM system associated)